MENRKQPIGNPRRAAAFFWISILTTLLGVALIVRIVVALIAREASAYQANGRSGSVLINADAVADPAMFWFFIGAWGLGAVLLFYLAFQFWRAAKVLRSFDGK